MAISSILRDKIIKDFQNLPEDIKSFIPTEGKISDNDYATALSEAHDESQRVALIHLFLLNNYEKVIPNLDDCLDILTHIFNDVGITESTNPFITFIKFVKSDASSSNKILTKDNLIMLNDLYADNEIDFNDISGYSKERRDHPIFKPGFYDSSDPEFLLDSYNFLSQTYNLRRLNYDTLVDSSKIDDNNLKELIKDKYYHNAKAVSSISDNDAQELRQAFMQQGNGFKDPNTLRSILTIASREKTASDDSSSSLELRQLSKEARKTLNTSSKEDREKFIQSLADDYDVKL